MKQGCKIISLGDDRAIICGSEIKDHVCNEDAICFDTKAGERFTFEDSNKADKWYKQNYKIVVSGSVMCSICKRAAIDDMMFAL
jgi:hypothetical protein